MTNKNRIIIFDTTMRDGEQSPGASMSLEEKLQISRVFDELGIDVIEAGFPIASPGDFEAVTEISKTLKKSIPAGLARATKKDIDACHEALRHAKNFRIHTFISTSPLHMKHKLNKSPEEVLEAVKESVSYARKFTICRTATSIYGSVPISFALYSLSPTLTKISSAFAIT